MCGVPWSEKNKHSMSRLQNLTADLDRARKEAAEYKTTVADLQAKLRETKVLTFSGSKDHFINTGVTNLNDFTPPPRRFNQAYLCCLLIPPPPLGRDRGAEPSPPTGHSA